MNPRRLVSDAVFSLQFGKFNVQFCDVALVKRTVLLIFVLILLGESFIWW